MKLYLTTNRHCDEVNFFLCHIWRYEPELCSDGYWGMGGDDDSLHAGRYRCEDLAALGFPPPGKMRVIETGEYEEAPDD